MLSESRREIGLPACIYPSCTLGLVKVSKSEVYLPVIHRRHD